MPISDHPKAYGTAALMAAFAVGIAVTLGFQDFYPYWEGRYSRRKRGGGDVTGYGDGFNDSQSQATLLERQRAARRRRSTLLSSIGAGPVLLQDHESDPGGDPGSSQPDIRDGIEACIGNTPMIKIRSLSEATGCTILAKAEFLNGAGGSPKDRVALNMILTAEESGHLVPGRGDTIYEGTVGSTGISLAMLARARGYRCHICMPDDVAREKSDLLLHLGATVERVPVAPITDKRHFVNLARSRAEAHTAAADDDSVGFFAGQFENPANWQAHLNTTGPEIVEQTGGRVDAFVAGAGTGGTMAGVAVFLKEEARMHATRVVLADPQGSGLYNKVLNGVMYSPSEREGTRRRQQVDSVVEGIGLKWVTGNFERGRELVDDAVRITDEQACAMARWLVEHDGIFAGSSSAVNCAAAVVTAMRMPRGSHVVTILCDSGSRHLSRFYKQVADLGLEGDVRKEGAEGGARPSSPEDLLALLGLKPREDSHQL
ncbi:uncharacterized protein PpBr36_05720 [Pyricularia pennisetigena]|uniref:uncharacterized protein n=1 Tax=Pyricularia pennisetigena TaxID=1578925 RepID=UPI00114F2206|nr:uncharacterized protein PpBr36_05720 [Pyricularia pennisetigena]TLS23232.1 hypothetical protein PpBr36_05720 [Pyricularia pennisetigena]